MKTKKTYTARIQGHMWAMGMPTNDRRFADIFRAALKAGLDEGQAFALMIDAFNASKGYDWKLKGIECSHALHRATVERNAKENPNGKCAEDLAAQRDGRPSRWGTPEFHKVQS